MKPHELPVSESLPGISENSQLHDVPPPRLDGACRDQLVATPDVRGFDPHQVDRRPLSGRDTFHIPTLRLHAAQPHGLAGWQKLQSIAYAGCTPPNGSGYDRSLTGGRKGTVDRQSK